MKNNNLKLLVMSLLTVIFISGCSVQAEDHYRRSPGHDRDHGRYNHHHRDNSHDDNHRRDDDHHDRQY